MEDIVKETANDMDLAGDNLEEFVNTAFRNVAKEQQWSADKFQSQASKIGTTFEYCFKTIVERLYPNIPLTHEEEFPEACMKGRSEADFASYKNGIADGSKQELLAVYEAKGSPKKIQGKDGNVRESNRPGMQRTDTVKKAICNAYQIYRAHPDALFFIVTSHKPERGSAKCMCNLAEGDDEKDVVDKVVDVTSKRDMDEMAKKLQKVL
ncbi:MAG: hypothetical protein ABEI06_05620 [Halobacteriaceae archaeon]